MGGSWQTKKISRNIFNNLYKITGIKDLFMNSLRNFILLEGYLKQRGYTFLFSSFINYWNTVEKNYVLHKGEYNLGYFCKNEPIFKNFDFSNWLFVNDNKDTICEFSWDPVLSQGDLHPRDEMHQRFAQEVVLPRVQQIHV